jgi:hypothetical protein
MPKPCLPTQIINPQTGKCVKKDGKIGKLVLAMQTSVPKMPVPLQITYESLTQQADQSIKQMTNDFFKLCESEQIQALKDDNIRNQLNITDIYIKSRFQKVWQLILSQYRDQLEDLKLMKDLSLDPKKRTELIDSLGKNGPSDNIFEELINNSAMEMVLMNSKNEYIKSILSGEDYFDEIYYINAYNQFKKFNLIDYNALAFTVRPQTFEFLIRKFVDKFDVDQLKNILSELKSRKKQSNNMISRQEQEQRLAQIIQAQK